MTMDIKRRELLKYAGLSAAAASVSVIPTVTGLVGQAQAATSTNHKVVVIGGGFGGSTVAKYLRLWGQGQVDVTLVDAGATYKTPILSNLVLNGQKTISNLTIDLKTSVSRNGGAFVQGKVLTIERNPVAANGRVYNGQVKLLKPDNTQVYLPYDKLVLAPGVEFDYLPTMALANKGYTDKTCPIPHAWQSGDQVLNLKAQIDKIPTGGKGVFVLCIPKKPYRCPPGPYERACVVADILKRVKGGGKLIIFDANSPAVATDKYSAIQAETHTFTTAFTGQFAGIVEYVPNAELISVSATGGQFGKKTANVRFPDGSTRTQTCNVLNVLPTHKASQIVFDAKLIDHPSGPFTGAPVDRFVPVNLQNYAYAPNREIDQYIHVIGDSHKSSQPKAGHVANSEAKVCADAIVREFNIVDDGLLPENMIPVTNSACYSPITNTTASWLTAGYRFNPTTKTMDRIAESFNEAEMPSSDNYKMMLAWANNLFADTFSI
jgi:sulfide dehydrogenase [flavocytochrome c] flavoprotein subunit